MSTFAAKPGAASVNFNRPPRIFVLDDQPLVANSIAQVLNSRGYEAYPSYTTTGVLDMTADVSPDLLITDVALGPNTINGFDLAIYFERFFTDCRVILISGDPNSGDLHRRARGLGHDFLLLHKPIAPQKLLDIVAETLSHLQKAA